MIASKETHLYLVLDEAHPGMKQAASSQFTIKRLSPDQIFASPYFLIGVEAAIDDCVHMADSLLAPLDVDLYLFQRRQEDHTVPDNATLLEGRS